MRFPEFQRRVAELAAACEGLSDDDIEITCVDSDTGITQTSVTGAIRGVEARLRFTLRPGR